MPTCLPAPHQAADDLVQAVDGSLDGEAEGQGRRLAILGRRFAKGRKKVDDFTPSPQAQLVADAVQLGFDRPDRDPQLVGDLAVGQVGEPGYFEFTLGQ